MFIQLPYSEELNTGYLSRLFDNTSECYKLFWFKAIVMMVNDGKVELTYDELINRMVVDAWYMVKEYHLNLGPKDTLESLINVMMEKAPKIKSSAKEAEILEYLSETDDKEILEKKRILTYNVPYRLQAPFLPDLKGKDWNVSASDLANRINQGKRLIYYFNAIKGLSTKIEIQEDWAEYIKRNYEIILGWIEYNMIIYLQRRNPNVCGISNKLSPPVARNLEKVKKYWKLILTLEPVYEIYGEQLLTSKDISVDHFVPWSYVTHDELWNLSPTTKSINSSKSNNLPKWDIYFKRLVNLEYQSYRMMWQYDVVREEFEKCAKEHINSNEIRSKIYREGLELNEFAEALQSVVEPVYKDAQNCGFTDWEYQLQ